MTDLHLTPHTFPMPEIPGVTITHGGLHYLQPELLLDFISVSTQSLISVTPVALLYSTIGVLQRIDLRKIPITIKGRVVYPVSSQALPSLRARLIINGPFKKLKFQGTLISASWEPSVQNMTLIGLALEFTVPHP
ncbi:dTDP-glucose pyrophosphorylase [Buttiauxella sp. B2]|uniref:dTDP-glucose pyrophosphorylase n=1 Tax=Buttiauxella sp. B2 TaxID=2587812 RepID=UPI0011232A22|nr:dTDP-glucose pyrophosphorylase [Buttiauxella sp. B2]TNV20758.1 dTDP-glucose pyrophosphorylase [Buttiauxella sp. B2]